MDIVVRTVDAATVVELTGEIDATTAGAAQQRILSAVAPGGRLLLGMRGVTYMSSAGLRMLLSTHRHVTENGGRLVLVGLSPELRETMSVTGFLNFFVVNDDVDLALRELNA